MSCKYLLKLRDSPLTVWSTERNKTASPLLRLPAELRIEIYKLVSEKFVLDRFHKRPVQITRTRVPLLSTCRQVRDEASDLDDQSHVLRLETHVSHINFIGTGGEGSSSSEHAMNGKIHTLEIHKSVIQLSNLQIDLFFLYCLDIPRVRLQNIFPNVKRVELYGDFNHSLSKTQVSNCLGLRLESATEANVEIVLASTPAPEPVKEVY